MRKLGKKLVAVAGVIAMLMIILVYGFAETVDEKNKNRGYLRYNERFCI